MNGDLLADSGTASRELKTNLFFFAALIFFFAADRFLDLCLWPFVGSILAVNLIACHRLLRRFFKAGGVWFGIRAAVYFLFGYPLAVWAGAGRGLFDVVTQRPLSLRETVERCAGNKERMASSPLLETRK
jgi:hypothetical protein